MEHRLLATLRKELARQGDPSAAQQMQAYMKSDMPCHGVKAPGLREVCKRVFEDVRIASTAELTEVALAIWRGARYREERHAAIELTGHKKARGFQTMDVLPLYEEMIVEGRWWDYVDAVAIHRLGPLLRRYPKDMRREMLSFSRCPDMWKRRSAIICQNTFKEHTDTDLLYACIEPSIGSTEFFLRKAIGWALRQYGWKNPQEVVRYVRARQKDLHPLSQREALKALKKQGALPEIA